MKRLILRTAWPMTPPLPFSTFHLLFTFFGVFLAAFLARRFKSLPIMTRVRLLFGCGIILAVSEFYKQLFLYYIVNQGCFDWWYFPFQLCSLPMYLCLLLPFLSKGGQQIACTFMCCYNLLGAFMVFVEPSGLMHPYWSLTLHSFLWHILLVFIGFLIAFSGMAGSDVKSFLKATFLFLLCCIIATGINVLSHPYGNANMFYITPYYPNVQMIYSQISSRIGTLAGNFVYIFSIIAGAGLVHLAYRSVEFSKHNSAFNHKITK